MKATKPFLFVLVFLSISCSKQAATDPVSFNEGWKFHKGDIDGAQNADLDDASWRDITLPHDWAIEGPFDWQLCCQDHHDFNEKEIASIKAMQQGHTSFHEQLQDELARA